MQHFVSRSNQNLKLDIKFEQNFELKIKKLYSFTHKMYKKYMFKTNKALKHLFNSLQMYFWSFQAHVQVIFGVQKLFLS
jgi:hypothetical protein